MFVPTITKDIKRDKEKELLIAQHDSHTFIPTAAEEYGDATGDSPPRLDSAGGVAPLDEGDDAFECMLTDRATVAKATPCDWDRGLRDVSDKGEDAKFPLLAESRAPAADAGDTSCRNCGETRPPPSVAAPALYADAEAAGAVGV